MDIKEHAPLKEFTTFGIGGPARYLAVAESERQFMEAVSFAKQCKAPLFILGGGSNILISDQGFPGLVILSRIKGLHSREQDAHMLVSAGAGEDWDAFVKECTGHDWQGLECLSGIPGTVGAAPVQNIGAYGQSVEASIHEVRAINVLTGGITSFANRECGFAYRSSIFNTQQAGRHAISGVTFRLSPGGIPALTYHDLKNCFSGESSVTPAKVREAVLGIRDRKGLLILDGHESFKSAGSFFKNPVLSAAQFEKVKGLIRDGDCASWAWPMASGEVKVSAACLIQCAGFPRGYRQGDAGISPRHSLVLINHHSATSDEIVALARRIQDEVKGKFWVILKPEVQFVGFPREALL
ncbi:MAG TPA: UDP-N-acetylmuramate dehydrogenase [Dissulfurispiraceae bacterium]